MPAFVHPALLWGLGLIALPILIHLINLWRHRRVEWAAMEFLLESKKKNQRWVVLRQWLLLLLRVLAVAAVVLILAQPLLRNQWGAMVGAARSHHVVLLDDSYSMTDRWAETSAFGEARQAIDRVARRALGLGPGQRFTLLRFSRAGEPASPDLQAATVNAGFVDGLGATLAKLQPSETAADPLPALESADRLLGESAGENVVIYLLSDFRANQWRQPDALRDKLAAWNAAGRQIHFIQCVDRAHPNLGVSELRPARGMLAAGVPFFMEVTVKNFGAEIARNVSVSLREDEQVRPAVVIEEIEPGRTETRRFLVNFATAGEHVVTAALETDSVALDNSRQAVVEVPVGIPVLVVDGAAEGADARFLSTALAPGGSIRTGIDVRLETPRFLSNQDLSPFRTIFLTNVNQLDASAVAALENFVRSGGGLGIFVGDSTDGRVVNEQLYREGAGLFPLPLTSATHLFVDAVADAPDLQVDDHPVFKVFLGERNSFLSAVKFEKYFGVVKNSDQQLPAGTKVIARLRNGAPLVVERKFGAGRVLAFLSSVAPVWNNWGRNPSFVVAMLESQSYLAAHDAPPEPLLVGSPLTVDLPAGAYQPRVEFLLPGEDQTGTAVTAQVDGDRLRASLPEVAKSGLYRVRLQTKDGRVETRSLAVSVVPDEGNLALIENTELAASLPGLRFDHHTSDDLGWEVRDLAGFNLSDTFLYAMVALLVGEQFLAFRNSYHPAAREGRA